MGRNRYKQYRMMCPFKAILGRRLCKRCQRLAKAEKVAQIGSNAQQEAL